MATATINLRVQPFRLLTKGEAARYLRRSPKQFDRCPVRPVKMENGDELFDVKDLDDYVERLKGGGDDADDIIGRLA